MRTERLHSGRKAGLGGAQENTEPIAGAGSRKEYFAHVAEVLGWKGRPRIPAREGLFLWVGNMNYDPTNPQCTRPGQYICGPFDTMVATPEYDPEGKENINRIKAEMDAYNLELAGVICENLDSDNMSPPSSTRHGTPSFATRDSSGAPGTASGTPGMSGGTSVPCRSWPAAVPGSTACTCATSRPCTPAACA